MTSFLAAPSHSVTLADEAGTLRGEVVPIGSRMPSALAGRRLEIGRLALHPFDKATQSLILQQTLAIRSKPGKLGIGEVLVDRTVAYRMERNRLPPLFRLGNKVMPLHARAEFPTAQPATLV